MRHIKWHIGCSGFYYKEWKGAFYPEKLSSKNWFSFYAQHFSTLEINNTFYRFPEQKLFDNWYDKTLPDFTFSVKVPQVITHLQKFKETETLLQDFYAIAAAGLKEKLGPILFQLPPSLTYNEGLLQAMISQMDIRYKNVIEFRHISWWRKEVFAALQKAEIVFCGVSYPGLINNPVTDLPISYYRFHGVPKLYHSAYEESFLQRIAQEIAGSITKEAYLYFNNTASGAAIENAKFLQYLVGTST